jgi:regulator of protease activity HflC (stomatin/prohibitin superfamily)
MDKQKQTKLGMSAMFVIIAAVAILSSSIYTVKYGSVAVITRFQKIESGVKHPGLHFKVPFIDQVLTYRTQKIVYETTNVDPYSGASNADYQDYAVDTTTQDGQQVSITYTLRFSIDPAEVRSIANTLGTEKEVVEKIIKAETRIKARSVPRNFKAFDLYTGNIDTVSQQIADILAPVFTENGLILDEFGIRAIGFSDEYVTTIEEKQIEREKIDTAKFIADQEEFKKQAAITKAEGEAAAQKLLQVSLSKELLQKLYIEKWDGILPEIMPGDSSSLLLDLNK